MESKLLTQPENEDLIFSLVDLRVLKVSARVKRLLSEIDWENVLTLEDFERIAPLPGSFGKRGECYPRLIDVKSIIALSEIQGGGDFLELGWYNPQSESIHLLLFPISVESSFCTTFDGVRHYMDRLQKPAVLFDFLLERVVAANRELYDVIYQPLSVLGQGFRVEDFFIEGSVFQDLMNWKNSADISYTADLQLRLKDSGGCWFEVGFSKVKIGQVIHVLAVFRDIDEAVKLRQRQSKKSLITSRLSKVQNSFLSKTPDFNPYQLFLDAILDISGAAYGFVGEVGDSQTGQRLMKIHAVTDFSLESESARQLLNKLKDDNFFFSHFDNLFGACIRNGEVICENNPPTNPHSSNRKIVGHPQISNFLGIPILNGASVVGLIGLGNKTGGFYESDVEDLQPFASTYSVILNALENEERNHLLQKDSSDKSLILSTVGDHSPDTIVVLDAQMQINFLSPGYKKHFGVVISETDARQKIKTLVIKTLADKYRQSEEHYRSRLRIRTLDQDNRWLETSLNIFDSGSDKKIIAFVREVTTQVKSELSLKASLKKERQFKHFLSEFMSVLAHEFKTPLATIMSSLELSDYYLEAMDGKESEMIRNHLKKMRQEAENLHRIVLNSLTYERFVKEEVQLKKESLRLGPFVEETLEQYGFSSRVELESGVPPELKVHWDRFLMQTTIVNLVGNAIKYTTGKRKPVVSIKTRDSGFSLSVEDYGIGIAEKDLPYIFTPFFRGDNAQKVEGTGMGLIAVKNFVRLHGGHIKVSSKLSQGAVFTLIFDDAIE